MAKKGLSRDAIKYCAVFAMLLNHIAAVFLPPGSWVCEVFTDLGYYTAITMIFFLVEGYGYTHSKSRYLKRLLCFALISEIPYCLAFTKEGILEFTNLNMLFTLCLCFLLIWGLDSLGDDRKKEALCVGVIAASCFCDWAVLAPVYTLLFYHARGSSVRTRRAFVLALVLFGLFNLLSGIGRLSVSETLLSAVFAEAGMGAGVCSLLFLYNGKKGRRGGRFLCGFSKWFFYLFYPAHLLILGILRLALAG